VSAAADGGAGAALARIVEQVRAAAADGTGLNIRGGGTKDFYGGPAIGAPLETGELRGICSYEPTELVITARAGTPLEEIESALAEKGQCLAFEPPRFGAGGTVGGMVAAGLAGPARASSGSVRDFVLGATILNGRAELLRFGGQVMKNVAGYDVSRVFAGSLGILGVICEVSLKVPPRPAARATLTLTCSQAEAIAHLQAWAGTAVPISASAWRADVLHLRLSGARAAVEAASRRLGREHGARVLDAALADRYWEALRDQREDFFAAARPHDADRPLWRLSVPAPHPPLDLPGDTLIEWGGAQRWLRSDATEERIRAVAARAGGHATLFRTLDRGAEFLAPLSPPLERIHRALKQSFDPAGIFNRGRLYSWL
jgi:glycolate oxidase FAD binding subunit